jgi:hypothetical protein
MAEALKKSIAVVGIDISKNSFRVVGLDECGAIVLQQKWSRGQGGDKREHGSRRAGFRAERLHASHSLSGLWLGHGVLSNRFATVRHTSPGISETLWRRQVIESAAAQ